MPNWVRHYEGDQDDLYTLRYMVAGGMSVASLFPLCGFAVGELPGAAAPIIVLFVMMWEVLLWRVMLVGVYVSDYGIKIRMVLHTRVIPWSHVTRVGRPGRQLRCLANMGLSSRS